MMTLECWSASSVSLLELGYSRLWNGVWEYGTMKHVDTNLKHNRGDMT